MLRSRPAITVLVYLFIYRVGGAVEEAVQSQSMRNTRSAESATVNKGQTKVTTMLLVVRSSQGHVRSSEGHVRSSQGHDNAVGRVLRMARSDDAVRRLWIRLRCG